MRISSIGWAFSRTSSGRTAQVPTTSTATARTSRARSLRPGQRRRCRRRRAGRQAHGATRARRRVPARTPISRRPSYSRPKGRPRRERLVRRARGDETLRAAITTYPEYAVRRRGRQRRRLTGWATTTAPRRYPCNVAELNVICVGAPRTRTASRPSRTSAPSVDLFAPGAASPRRFPGTALPAAFGFMRGTSMATPHVAAAAALVLQAEPTLSAGDVKAILLASADAGNAFSGRSLIRRSPQCECRRGARPSWHVAAGW